MTEEVGERASVVTDFQFETNTYSDSQFLKDHVSQTETQEEGPVLVTEGAYCGLRNTELCAEKNISLVTTSLTGRPTEDIMADFEFSEDGQEVLRCPAGNSPQGLYIQRGDRSMQNFIREGLLHEMSAQRQAQTQDPRKNGVAENFQSGLRTGKVCQAEETEENRNLARFRNGVETLPSVLRRIYGCDDRLPRGKTRASFFMASKIGALNFGKFLTKLRGSGRYAQNPVFAEKF